MPPQPKKRTARAQPLQIPLRLVRIEGRLLGDQRARLEAATCRASRHITLQASRSARARLRGGMPRSAWGFRREGDGCRFSAAADMSEGRMNSRSLTLMAVLAAGSAWAQNYVVQS